MKFHLVLDLKSVIVVLYLKTILMSNSPYCFAFPNHWTNERGLIPHYTCSLICTSSNTYQHCIYTVHSVIRLKLIFICSVQAS